MAAWRFSASPSLRVTLFMSCLFAVNGVGLPFLPVWLAASRGLSGFEVGVVLSSAQLARVFVGPLIATWADGFADRRTPLRLLALAALAGYAAFALSSGFWALAVAGFLAATLGSAMAPLVESAALRAGRAGWPPFGVGRAIGSAAFIVGALLAAAGVARFGPDAAIAGVLALMGLSAAIAWLGLAPDRRAASGPPLAFHARLRAGGALLRNPRVFAVLAASGLIQAAHAFYYSFSTLAWARQGFDEGLIGLLWAIGVAFEVVFLAALPAIERRVSPEALVIAGGAGAVLRWAAFGFSPPAALLFPLQALHALTFAATHVGALRILEREAPDALSGFAQTLYAALAAGALMGVATLGAGWLFDQAGVHGYWAMAALAAAGLIGMARAPSARSPAAPEPAAQPAPVPAAPPPQAAPD